MPDRYQPPISESGITTPLLAAKVQETVTKTNGPGGATVRFDAGEVISVWAINGAYSTSIDPDHAFIFEPSEVEILKSIS